jgi:hypothetical protein
LFFGSSFVNTFAHELAPPCVLARGSVVIELQWLMGDVGPTVAIQRVWLLERHPGANVVVVGLSQG